MLVPHLIKWKALYEPREIIISIYWYYSRGIFICPKLYKGGLFMQDKAREKRNSYMREWRKKNKDKVKKYNDTYWERKANILEKEDE